MVSNREHNCENINGSMLQLSKQPRSLQTMSPKLQVNQTHKVVSQETMVRTMMPVIKNFNKSNYIVKKGVRLETPPDDRYFEHLNFFMYQISIFVRNVDIYNQVSIFFKGSEDAIFYLHLTRSIERTTQIHQYMAYMLRIFMRYYLPTTVFANSTLKLKSETWNRMKTESVWYVMLEELVVHFAQLESDEGYFDVIANKTKFSNFLLTISTHSEFMKEVIATSQEILNIMYNKFINTTQGKTRNAQNKFLEEHSLEGICKKHNVHMLVFAKMITYTVVDDLFFIDRAQRLEILRYFKSVGENIIPSINKDFIFSRKFLTSQVDIKMNIETGKMTRLRKSTQRKDRKFVIDSRTNGNADMIKDHGKMQLNQKIQESSIVIDVDSKIAQNSKGNLLIQDGESTFEIVPNGFGDQITRQNLTYTQKLQTESQKRLSVSLESDFMEQKQTVHQRNVEPSAKLLSFDSVVVDNDFTKEITVTNQKTMDTEKLLISQQIKQDPKQSYNQLTKVEEKPFTSVMVNMTQEYSFADSPKKGKSQENGEQIVGNYLRKNGDSEFLMVQKIDGMKDKQHIEQRKNDMVEEVVLLQKKTKDVLVVNETQKTVQTDPVRKLEDDINDMKLAAELKVNQTKIEILKEKGLEIIKSDEKLNEYFEKAVVTFESLYDSTTNQFMKQIINIIFNSKINRTGSEEVPLPLLMFEQDTLTQISQVTNQTKIAEQEMTQFLSFLILMSTFMDPGNSGSYFGDNSKLLMKYDSREGEYYLPQPELLESGNLIGNEKLIMNMENNILTLRHQLIVSLHDTLIERMSEIKFDYQLKVDKDYRAILTIIGDENSVDMWYIAERVLNIEISQLGEYTISLVAMSNESHVETDISLESLFSMNVLKNEDMRELVIDTQRAVVTENEIDHSKGDVLVKSSLNNPSFVKDDEYMAVSKVFESKVEITVNELVQEAKKESIKIQDDTLVLIDKTIQTKEQKMKQEGTYVETRQNVMPANNNMAEMLFEFDIDALKKMDPNFDLAEFQRQLEEEARLMMEEMGQGGNMMISETEFSLNQSLTSDSKKMVTEMGFIQTIIEKDRRLLI
jgi:hypothetical protein